MKEEYRQQLENGLIAIEYPLSDEKIEILLSYHQLLIKWNKAYNLTAVRDPIAMISRHLLDSLTIDPFLTGQRFIDVGTGAGLPGIILAIIFPEREFHLLDSNGKKTRFLFQVKTELGLSNVTVHHCRVEKHHPEQIYDGVLSRAFATLSDMVDGSQHLLADNGHFYAMKGLYPTEELSDLEKTYKVKACHRLQVPNSDSERHLVLMTKQAV